MGLSPAEVDGCSIWQFQAAAEGFRRANMTEEEQARELTSAEIIELSDYIDRA